MNSPTPFHPLNNSAALSSSPMDFSLRSNSRYCSNGSSGEDSISTAA
ncbi:MAG TPA: hypothetical protein PK640_00145 [Verrucomicrobiota bacterium]|nr:hypothetical protein [Verrucomicrobiota bacterium]